MEGLPSLSGTLLQEVVAVPIVVAEGTVATDEAITMETEDLRHLSCSGHLGGGASFRCTCATLPHFKSSRLSTLYPSNVRSMQCCSMQGAQIASMVHIHNIPAELVMNLDQTGINLVPAGNWTTAPQGSTQVALAGVGDKRQVTATFACTLSGDFLNMHLLHQGKTNRCHPKFDFPEGFDVHHTPNHWATEETSLWFIKKVIIPM